MKIVGFPVQVVWVWAVCFLGIAIYSIAWFSLGWGAMMFIEAVEEMYTFESPADVTISFIKTVFAWHPILFILGLLIWAYVNSQRREDVTYPIGYR